jgi:hypothetical protein
MLETHHLKNFLSRDFATTPDVGKNYLRRTFRRTIKASPTRFTLTGGHTNGQKETRREEGQEESRQAWQEESSPLGETGCDLTANVRIMKR